MSRPRPTLRVAVHAVLPLVLAFALYLLLVGHDEPGGGFAAGLVVSGALALGAIARPETRPKVPTETVIGGGLLLALGVAAAPMLLGNPLLTSGSVDFSLGPIGAYKLSSVLVFDIGVLLVVVGLASAVLDRVREVLT